MLDYARTENSSPILCAQNTPGRVSYDEPAIADGSVTIVVHTFYSGPPVQDNRIRVTVDPATQKLTDLACLGLA